MSLIKTEAAVSSQDDSMPRITSFELFFDASKLCLYPYCRQRLSKIVKIPLWVLTIIVGLALILLLVIQTSWFKNYAAHKATTYLSKELGTEVSIGDIQLDYFDRLTATDVSIKDLNSDTMIHVARLEANYDLFSFSGNLISFDKVVLDEATVYLGFAKDSTRLNIQFLVDYFTPPPSNKPPKSPKLVFDEVELTNSKFNYYNRNYSPPEGRSFDENNLFFNKLNGKLKNLEIINDSLVMQINKLQGIEKSGLHITELTAKSIISRTTMQFDKLMLTTPKSTLQDFLLFKYSRYGQLSAFIDSVQLKANLKNSKLHTDDLAYFGESLKAYNELITTSGELNGTIADISSKNLEFNIGTHTQFEGPVHLQGLPDIDKTYIDLYAKKLETNATDLVKLIELDPAPTELLALGNISYSGSFIGYISDFDVSGKLGTDVGNAVAQLHYVQLPKNNARYKGKIASESLALNKLLGIDELGVAAFDLEIDGSGLSLETIKSNVAGTVSKFEYNGYTYQNMNLRGDVADNVYNGFFQITDPNFNFNFTGALDASKDIPEIDVTTQVVSLNLKALGIDTEETIVRFDGKIDLSASSINTLNGFANLDGLEVLRNGKIYKLKKLNIDTKNNPGSNSNTLDFDLGKVSMNGDFLMSELGLITENILHIVNPSQFERPIDSLQSKNINLTAALDKYHPIYSEYLDDFLFDSAYLELNYDQTIGKITSKNRIHNLDYQGINTAWATINLNNADFYSPVNFAINTPGLDQKDSVLFDIFNANGFLENGIVNFETTSQRDSILDIILTGRFYSENDTAKVFLDQSNVDIYGKTWTLKKTDFPNLIYSKGITEFRYFDFRHNEEIMFIDASMGDNADKLNLVLTNFTVENLMPFLAGYNVDLSGIANGFVDVSDRNGFPIIESDLVIDNLQLNSDTLGTLILKSNATADMLVVNFDGRLEGGLLEDMKIFGDINFNNKKSPLNLTLSTENSSIKPFERYLSGLASNIEGLSTTQIRITGKLNEPKLNGKMHLSNLSFLVDYLQTTYVGEAFIDITSNAFTINKAKLYDRFKQEGKVTGRVTHQNFNNFLFDIKVSDLEAFEIMNTSRKDNDLFYGKAFVDGKMSVTGPIDDILLVIDAKSRKGTAIEIPLDNFETSGKLSYVEFVDLTADVNQLTKGFNTDAGVQMDFNFEVTNDASVTLVFDELLGDKIDASGHGNLRMEVNTYGDFNMYGGITVDRGNYLFTAFDLINKYFTVEPGGTLFWDGNPYNATINLEAIKREYPLASGILNGIVDDTELDQYNQAIPVDCHLILKGLLFNPTVTFDLVFPTQNSLNRGNITTLNTVIDRVKLDQEELNRQVFALLVLGTFIPPSFSSNGFDAKQGAQSTGLNSIYDLASNQLNNWLSQMDSKIKVGLDFQNTDQASKAEIILSLKRKFLNDRLELAASVDANSQAGNNSRPYDLSVQYNLSKDGSFKVRGFQRNANDPTLGNINQITTTGVGFFYRFQFDKFTFRRKTKVEEKADEITIENP